MSAAVQEYLASVAHGNATTVTTGGGTQVGWWLLAIQGWDYETLAEMPDAPTGTAGTWTLLAVADAGDNLPKIKVWARRVTVAGAQTVRFPCDAGSTQNHGRCYVISGGRPYIAARAFQADAQASGTAGTAHVAPGVYSPDDAAMLICEWMTGTTGVTNYTVPGSMTARAELDGSVGTSRSAEQALAVAGPTGTRTATAAAARPWAAASIVVRSDAGTVTFPDQPLRMRMEVAFGADLTARPGSWSWTDITPFLIVSPDNPITLKWGRGERANNAEPVTLGCKINNTTGWATPDDPRSPHWPNVVEQVPIRWWVDPGTGWDERFSGFVGGWPITWPSGTPHMAVGQITANGMFRRLTQTAPPLRSALYRTIRGLAPAAHWPLEDGDLSGQAASSLPGGQPMSIFGGVSFGTEGAPAGSSGAVSCDDLGSAGLVGKVVGMPATSPASWVLSFWINIPDGTSEHPAVEVVTPAATGYKRYVVIVDGATGLPIVAALLDDFGNNVAAATSSTDLRGRGPVMITVRAVQSGANVAVGLYIDDQIDASGTVLASTVAPITSARINARQTSAPIATAGQISHLVTTTDDQLDELMTQVFPAGAGWAGEPAAVRVQRLCGEEGIPVIILGATSTSEPMGPQPAGKLVAILRECEDADHGYLGDTTGHGVTYLPRSALYNQPTALTLDADQRQLGTPFDPVRDDAATRNEWTVSRLGGSEGLAVDTEHQRRSGQYPDAQTINVAADDRLADHAAWLVHLGTTPGVRYPSLSLNLTRHPDLIAGWLDCRPSSRIAAINLPPQHPPGDLDQLIDGATETVTLRTWRVSMNVRPALPWDVGVVGDDRLGRAGTAGSELAAGVDADDTTLSVATTGRRLWTTKPGAFPFEANVGGEVVTVTNITGSSSPQTMTVVRSVNGVTKAHSAGADVRLAQPMIVRL